MFVISTPSSRMVPSVGCSNPAISRSVVVFPQPEGPSSEKNSPLSTVRSIWSTATSVKRFVSATSSILPPAIAPTLPSPLPIRLRTVTGRACAGRTPVVVRLGQARHGDQLLQPPGRRVDRRHPARPGGVPGVLGEPDRLGQELVLGLEVVDDQGWAGAGPLGHVRDPGVRVPAFDNDLQRRPEHLLPALVGRARSIRPLPHGIILTDENALSTHLFGSGAHPCRNATRFLD